MRKVEISKVKSINIKSPLEEKPHRQPGQSSEEKLGILEGKLLLWIVIIAFLVVIIFVEWMYFFINIPLQPMGATIPASCLIAFSCWRISQINRTISCYRLGRDGEREVARTLENLIRRTGCYVYHSVVFNRNKVKFDIDHIILSNFGIFVIETKTRRKPKGYEIEFFDGNSVKLTNHPPDSEPIKQVRRNIRTLKDTFLPVEDINGKPLVIIGIVVYPGWNFPKNKMNTTSDIWVSNAKYLEFVISDLESIYTSEEVNILRNKVEKIAEIENQLQ
jgi:hypothetical protein